MYEHSAYRLSQKEACLLTLSQLIQLIQRQLIEPSKFSEFADDNFKCDKNGRKFSRWVENTVGKGEIARYEQFLLSPQCFQDSYCRHVKTRACLGKGQVGWGQNSLIF